MCRRFYSSGYTLIEVLVAFMILALALTVLLRIFSGGLRNVSMSSDYARAVLVAEAQLAATGITAELTPGETRGGDGEQFRWTRTISGYAPFDGYDGRSSPVAAYRIDVTVEWSRGGSTRHIDLSSIRLATAEKGS